MLGPCLPKTPITREDIAAANENNPTTGPLPSFFEFRVCDPLLTRVDNSIFTYNRDSTSPTPHSSSKNSESPTSTTTKNLGNLLSPSTPTSSTYDANLHHDSIFENSTYETPNMVDAISVPHGGEMNSELWQVWTVNINKLYYFFWRHDERHLSVTYKFLSYYRYYAPYTIVNRILKCF